MKSIAGSFYVFRGALIWGAMGVGSLLAAKGAAIPNVDSGLQRLYAGSQAGTATAALATASSVKPRAGAARFDSSGRVLVHAYLDGTATMAAVTNGFTALNGNVLGSITDYGHGVFAAYLPPGQIAAAAKIAGIRSLTMEHAPVARVGKYTSEGASILRTDVLNKAGLKGDGITVGVISDSFDTAQQITSAPPATTASQDVASGDLPVVNVLEDYPMGTDEGRAMCQIVYDEAPHSKLAFATAYVSEPDFANNILDLRTKACASVIVDDVGYFDEPVFSDGIIGQAVNKVSTNKTIAGKPAVYCSAAGNGGNSGYVSADRELTDASVRKAGNHGNLKLNVTDPTAANYLDPALTAGGWFNWNPNGGTEPSTSIEAPGPDNPAYAYDLFLQWDDAFDQDHGITTNYNFLVFDAKGNFIPAFSGTTNAFSVQQAFQGVGDFLLGTQYQIAITRTTQTDPKAPAPPARHHFSIYTSLDGESQLQNEYFTAAPLNVPGIIGHPGAGSAVAVAAYAFSWKPGTPYAPQLENFTSPGPVTHYFDNNGNRLATPLVLQKPEVAGIDGVLTTFFGAPYYNYPFAFFGTSAAAPSVAGVAAIMQEAAGGPGNITPEQVKAGLIASTHPRSSTVETTQAFCTTAKATVSFAALGQSYFSPNYITVNYSGTSGQTISQVTIDGTAAGLVFNTTAFAFGSSNTLTAQDVTVVAPSASTSTFTLKFKPGKFVAGSSFGFSVEQDVAGTFSGYTQDQFGAGVEAEDLASGATATVSFAGPKGTATGAFQAGTPTNKYLPSDGNGLIDGVYAVLGILPANSAVQLTP